MSTTDRDLLDGPDLSQLIANKIGRADQRWARTLKTTYKVVSGLPTKEVLFKDNYGNVYFVIIKIDNSEVLCSTHWIKKGDMNSDEDIREPVLDHYRNK